MNSSLPHEHAWVHSNVLLDAEWNARLGDFGLARFVQRNKSAQTASTIVGMSTHSSHHVQQTEKMKDHHKFLVFT